MEERRVPLKEILQHEIVFATALYLKFGKDIENDLCTNRSSTMKL